MTVPTVEILPPYTTTALANSPISITKMKIIPIATPGRERGTMISRKIWNAFAPMSRAASSTCRSIFASEKKMGPTQSTT